MSLSLNKKNIFYFGTNLTNGTLISNTFSSRLPPPTKYLELSLFWHPSFGSNQITNIFVFRSPLIHIGIIFIITTIINMTIFFVVEIEIWFILSMNEGMLKSWIFLLWLRISILITSFVKNVLIMIMLLLGTLLLWTTTKTLLLIRLSLFFDNLVHLL